MEGRPEPVGVDELETFELAIRAAFHDDPGEGDLARDLEMVERDVGRTLAIREDGQLVAVTSALSRTMTLPGGAEVPVAGISGVGVRPGYTRRGHMRALMRRQLDDIRAAGEPLAVLWASEGSIYGRYGYGTSSRRVTYEVDRDRAAFRDDVPLPAEPARLAEPADAVAEMARAYERARRPGMLARDDLWWERALYNPAHRRGGLSARRAVVQHDAEGPAGYALYAIKEGWGPQGPKGTVHVRELAAATPEAALGLWRFLLSLDLRRAVIWPEAPEHDPISYALRNSDAVARTLHSHGLWVRLVDAPAALAAREYSAPLDVVIELEDEFCPWNARRHRLTAEACEPTDRAPDLALSAESLASAYLGSIPLDALAAAGRVRELTPGALRAASVAFRGFPEPYTPDHF